MKTYKILLIFVGLCALFISIPYIIFLALIIYWNKPPCETYSEATYYIQEVEVYAKYYFSNNNGDMIIMFSHDCQFKDTCNMDYIILKEDSGSEAVTIYHNSTVVQFNTLNNNQIILQPSLFIKGLVRRNAHFDMIDTTISYKNSTDFVCPYIQVGFRNLWGKEGYVYMYDSNGNIFYPKPISLLFSQ